MMKRFLSFCLAILLFFFANGILPLVATAEPQWKKGDLDQDGMVSSSDAIYLLYHTLFGANRYPVTDPTNSVFFGGDMDGDDEISSTDAIYLLYHTLFGIDRYPLAGAEGWVTTAKEVMTNRLSSSEVYALPVASAEMTKAELRNLVCDYFTLQLSFQWTPDMDLTDYPTTYSATPKTIDKGTVYDGIPYQSTGTGNLYRWLEYYDEKTGVFSFEKAFAENGGYGEDAAVTGVETDENGNVTYKKYRSFMILFNQCSVASFWGWGRVINSANFAWTADMTVYNGFIPVGLFDYGYEYNGKTYDVDKIRRFGEKSSAYNPLSYDTDDVIADWNAKNGSTAMYQCYAKMKTGDCLVSPGHAMMVKDVTLVYKTDGSIDYAKSYATVLEQTESFTKFDPLGSFPYKRQGAVNRDYTFKKLQTKNYLPFTFAEYMDPSIPEEKAYLDYYQTHMEKNNPFAARYSLLSFTKAELLEMNSPEVEPSRLYYNFDEKKETMSVSEFSSFTIASNYPISDLFVTVTDEKGNRLLQNIHRAASAQIREVSASSQKSTWETDENGKTLTVKDGVAALANGKNTVTLTLQISTGEKLTAFSGTLIP